MADLQVHFGGSGRVPALARVGVKNVYVFVCSRHACPVQSGRGPALALAGPKNVCVCVFSLLVFCARRGWGWQFVDKQHTHIYCDVLIRTVRGPSRLDLDCSQ